MKSSTTIVMYHAISPELDPYTVSPAAFRQQISVLAGEYRITRLRDLGTTRGSVVITFDDAFCNFVDHALPVLEEFNVPVTMFVPTAHLGGRNEWDAPYATCRERRIMDADRLLELHRNPLVDFGSHTVDHLRMTRLTSGEMRRQATESKATLEQLLQVRVESFAYPFGQLGDFSDETERVLRDAGYRLAVTTHWGTRNTERRALRLGRIFFMDSDSPATIRRKTNGWYDWKGLKSHVGHAVRRVRSQSVSQPH